MRTAILILLCASAWAAQYGRPTTSRQRAGAPGSDLDILNTAVATFDGTLRSLDKKHVLLEMSEDQSLTIEVNKKTQFLRGTKTVAMKEFEIGTVVTVEAKKIANQMVAVSVRAKADQAETPRK